MDQIFKYDTKDEVFWMETAFPENRSAFIGYTGLPIEGFDAKSSGTRLNHQNLNKRMIDFLKRSRTPVMKAVEQDTERCYRHMINERMRREKQKQSYLALHSVLPSGTKNDKKSIIQMASREIEKLQGYKEELGRRKEELERIISERGSVVSGDKIRLKVPNPSSGIDSMVEVLKCLKSMGSKTRAIQSKFSPQEFSAVLDVQSQVEAGEVEKAVHGTLFAVERKFRSNS